MASEMLRTGEPGGLEVSRAITDDVGDVLEDAAMAVQDPAERAYIHCLVDRARSGELGIYTLSARCRTTGAIFYRSLDGDADLVFGHVVDGSGEAFFLGSVTDGLFSQGIHTIRSNFSWPEPGAFIREARALGFRVIERMSMCIGPAAITPSGNGFAIIPWQDYHLGEVSGIMCRDQSPADLPVYPMFSRPEGVRALMDSVLCNRHGQFMRDLSYVATKGGRIVGFLVTTQLPDGSLLILDVGVDRDHRRMGIGGALLDSLIGGAYRSGFSQIVLAVTSNNYDAIRLYERKGFKVNGYFRQHVLSKIS
jgi:GNAT superfamily N-acetyltransferase